MMQLFVSHISEEAELAALLKESMESDFLGLVNFFTSSDIGSIAAGEDWLAAVKKAMADAEAVIVLCSKAAVQRPWVHFEVGAAWMKGVPIIPVCHSGMAVTDLQMPLSTRQGIELGTERGIERLYQGIAKALKLKQVPRPNNLPTLVRRIEELEARFVLAQPQQFERYIDIVVPPPGCLQSAHIPDDAPIESDAVSLQLFGFIPGADRTWKDIARRANRTPDTRWLTQLQHCIHLASKNEVFHPVQAIYHTEQASYQPQLAKKEGLPGGACRYHVHFVETVVAPLSEVDNDFGLLATLLRLGLRFRYEVIERFRRQVRMSNPTPNGDQSALDMLLKLRSAVEVIENDALSRGAENIDRDAVAQLFNRTEDQDEMDDIQSSWDLARAMLFRTEPPPTLQEVSQVIKQMRQINYRFMTLGTRRFHEMVCTDWRDSQPQPPIPGTINSNWASGDPPG
jgi:hypothetical protein